MENVIISKEELNRLLSSVEKLSHEHESLKHKNEVLEKRLRVNEAKTEELVRKLARTHEALYANKIYVG